jgi:hypothetical protein
LSLCDKKRTLQVKLLARTRLAAALRRRRVQEDPVVFENGDFFLHWQDGVPSSQKGFKGQEICFGAYRALVVGMQGGHLVTSHVSRCVFYRRSPHSLAADPVLPDRQDRSLENALNTDLLSSFSMYAAVAEHFHGLKVQRPCDAADEYESTQI